MHLYSGKFKGTLYGKMGAGTMNGWDRKLCFQAHDDYFSCIDKLDEKSKKYFKPRFE
jgi:hypothetical protein